MTDERPRCLSSPLPLAPLFPSLPVLAGRPFSRVACSRISVSNSDPGHDPPSVFYCAYRKYPREKTSVRNVPSARSSHVLCIKVLCIRRATAAIVRRVATGALSVYSRHRRRRPRLMDSRCRSNAVHRDSTNIDREGKLNGGKSSGGGDAGDEFYDVPDTSLGEIERFGYRCPQSQRERERERNVRKDRIWIIIKTSGCDISA